MGLAIAGLSVGYPHRFGTDHLVLEQVDAELPRGQVAALIGPNGVGKSTLLRTIAGLRAPIRGSVTVDGVDVHSMSPTSRARSVAVVLTDRVEGGRFTAREIAALGRMPYRGGAGGDDEVIVDTALKACGATEFADRKFVQLSDGQRQRVMIARALAQEPALLILDEPSAFLDVAARAELVANLQTIAAERGMAVLFSTHDVELVLRSGLLLWLAGRDGQVVIGTAAGLVDSGRVEEEFDTAAVVFDRASRLFRVMDPSPVRDSD